MTKKKEYTLYQYTMKQKIVLTTKNNKTHYNNVKLFYFFFIFVEKQMKQNYITQIDILLDFVCKNDVNLYTYVCI